MVTNGRHQRGKGTTWILVVARTDPSPKRRLAELLTPDERERLALAMLEDVLAACRATRAPVAAVVAGDRGRGLARDRGAWVLDDPGEGLNQAVRSGIRGLIADRPTGPSDVSSAGTRVATVLVLPADLPFLTPEDVRALLALSPGAPRVTAIATDRRGEGTNALLLRPPRAIDPAFGPGSAAAHIAAGERTRSEVHRIDWPGTAFDIDTPDDLRELVTRPPANATGHFVRGLTLLGGPVASQAR